MRAAWIVIGILMVVTSLGDSAFATSHCGGLGEVPCKIWERMPSCDRGLVENFAMGKCVKPASGKPAPAPPPIDAGVQRDREIAAAMAGHANVLKPVVACMGVAQRKTRFTNALKSRNASLAAGVVMECATSSTLATLRVMPSAVRKYAPATASGSGACPGHEIKTWTIGLLGPGVQVVIGANVELGVALRLNSACGGHAARIYETHGWKLGPGIGAGVDLIPMALSRSPVQPGYTESTGRTVEIKGMVGGAFGVWNDNATKQFDSFSAAFGVGAALDFLSVNWTATNIF